MAPVATLLTGLGIDEVLVRTESTGVVPFNASAHRERPERVLSALAVSHCGRDAVARLL